MTDKRRTRGIPAVFVGMILLALGAGAAIALAAPTTTISRDPATPNGSPPWYVASPEVSLSSSEDGVTHYWWAGTPEATMPVSAGVPQSIGFAPQGITALFAYSVSASGTETPAASGAFYVDSLPPARPDALQGASGADGVVLSWDATFDLGASGVLGYWVYRSDSDGFFQLGDRIAFTATPGHVDGAVELGTEGFYAVSALDTAGNESFLSDSERVLHWIPVVPETIAGDDRYETSIEASRERYADGSVETVVIASGLDYPDALCASGIAGVVDSPVLLVGRGAIPGALSAELERLGAKNAYVVGGPAAVGSDTFASIQKALSGSVVRLWGRDRYVTAKAVAARIVALRGDAPPRVYLVSGENYPDALSVSAAAFADAAPVVYAKRRSLPNVSADALQATGAPATVIAGGPQAVWSGLEARVTGPLRVFGEDRDDTSRALADWANGAAVLDGHTLTVATAFNFPDGLSAGPLAGGEAGPVVLASESEAAELQAWLETVGPRFTHCYVVGGPAAVGPPIHAAIEAGLATP